MNSQETGAINATNDLSSATNGYLGQAAGLAGASTAAVNPTAVNGSTIAQYESPYQSDVVNATMAEIANQNKQQSEAQTSSAISAGAFGGDRAGVAQAALAGQQDLASNATLANLNNQNYSQALGEANTQQATTLSADQANRAALQSGSQIYSNLGDLASSTGIANANAQLQGGLLEQQTQQASDTAQYGQFENQQAYPFQTAEFLGGLTSSLAPELGTSSTGTTVSSPPNPLNSILGGGLGLAALLSDKRVKEDVKRIGKDFTGQDLYSFRYRGHPETHVGYIAQEIEKAHPEAVGRREDGMRVVDYAEASRKAAEKGHFARGGRTLGDLGSLGELDYSGLGGVRRYADGGMAGMPYSDASGYVPTVSLSPGHALQSAPMQGASTPTSPTSSSIPNFSPFVQAGQGLQNSSLGDAASDFAQDNLGLATGGRVVDLGSARRIKRGYDDGGVVPDTNSLLFDPNALGAPASLGSIQPGLGAAALPSTMSPAAQGLGAANLPSSQSQGLGAAANLPSAGPTGSLGNPPPVPVAPAGTLTPSAPNLASPASQGLGGVDQSGAGSGGLGAIDRVAPPSPTSMDSYYGRVRALESNGGDNSATSPSGAAGAYQIMPSTWTGLMRTHPELGLTSDGIRDPQQQEAAVRALTADNAAALKSALGRDPSPSELYLAHQQGAQGAISMLTQPGARAGDLVGDKAIAMNGGDPNMKAGDFANMWMGRFNGATPSSASAYAGTGNNGGGLGAAGPQASAGLGAAANIPSRFSDNFGTLIGGTGTPSADHSGGVLGLFPGVSDNARLGLAAAGFGMAASGSRSVGQAIGQGGLAGIQQYQGLQKLGVEQGLARANIAHAQAETADIPLNRAQHGIEVENESKKFQLQLAQIARQLAAAKEAGDINTTPSSMPAAGVSSQPVPLPQGPSANANQAASPPTQQNALVGSVPQVASPQVSSNASASTGGANSQDAAFWAKVDPNNNPFLLNQRADAIDRQAQVYRKYGNTEAANGLTAQATSLRSRVDTMAGKPVLMHDGTYQLPPSYTSTENAQEQAKTEAQQRGLSGTQMFEMNRPVYEAAAAAKDTAFAVKANAQALRNLAIGPDNKPLVNSGPQGEHFAEAASMLKQFGASDATIQRFTGTDPTNAEAMRKIATDMVGEVARQSIGPGNRLDQTEYRNTIKGVPSNEILPTTIKFLTDKILIPKANWTINRFGAVSSNDLHASNLQNDLFKYDQANPLDQVINPDPTRPAYPSAGQAPNVPAADQLRDGAVYATRHGPATWDAKAKIFRRAS